MANWAVELAMTTAIGLAHRSAADALRPAPAAFSARWFATSRATERGNALQGEVMPCRLWAMKNRRVAGT
jgi:hypothetical protein